MPFTDKQIKSLKTRATPYRQWESSSDKGFGVQVTPKGTKTFFLFYRLNNRRRFFNIGKYPNTSLAAARQAARTAKAMLEQGVDPQEDRLEKISSAEKAKVERIRQKKEADLNGSIAQLFSLYVAQMRHDKKRSADEVERALTTNALNVLGPDTKTNTIKPHHIKLVLHTVIKRGALIQANRLRSYLSAAFRFGIEYDNDPTNLKTNVLFFLESNPVRDVPKPIKRELASNKELSASEINYIWHLLENTPSKLSHHALKLLLATGGQRVQEVLHAQWHEFDLQKQLWEIPGSRTKNRKTHLVPLGDIATALLTELQAVTGQTTWLYPKNFHIATNDNNPMPTSTLNRAMTRFCEQYELERFNPRDIRRTCKSRMGELGLSKEIRDRLHNHALSDVSTKHYDRYDYLREKSIAIKAWDHLLSTIILGSNINTHTNLIKLKKMVSI